MGLSHRARAGLILTGGMICLILGVGLVLFCLFSESWRFYIETVPQHECQLKTPQKDDIKDHNITRIDDITKLYGCNQVNISGNIGGEITDGLLQSTRRTRDNVMRISIDTFYAQTDFPYFSRLVLITGGMGIFCGMISIILLAIMIAKKTNLRIYMVCFAYAAGIFCTTGLVLYAKQLTASYSFLVYAYAPILFQIGISMAMSTNVGLGPKGPASERASINANGDDTYDIDLDRIDAGIVLGEIDVIQHSASRHQRQTEEAKSMTKSKKKKDKKRNQQSAMSDDDMESMDDDEEFARVAQQMGDELQ